MTARYLKRTTTAILAVFLAATYGLGRAQATRAPRYDTFRSRLSGNVVRIPARCWAEDSMSHLYVRTIGDGGARYTFGCHHKGY